MAQLQQGSENREFFHSGSKLQTKGRCDDWPMDSSCAGRAENKPTQGSD